MSMIQLNENEHNIIKDLLDTEIKRITKIGGDPFYTADIVNIYRKMDVQTVPLVDMRPKVVHGASQDITESKPPIQDESEAMLNQPVSSKILLGVKRTEPIVTSENIDELASQLEDIDQISEAQIEKPRQS